MRKLLAFLATVCLSVAGAGAIPGGAINSYNATPAPERTEVGAFMALWDRSGDGVLDRFDWYCSGTMVDDDTLLTAAHCTDDWPAGTRFFVSLLQDVQSRLDQAVADGLSATEAAEWFLASGHSVEGDTHRMRRIQGRHPIRTTSALSTLPIGQ